MGMTPGEKKAWNKGFEEGANSVEEGLPGWFGTFADMMTLLFAFFVLLAAISTMDPVKLQEMANSEGKSLGSKIKNTQEKIMMKLVVCNRTDKILGCHIVGDGASEMIQMFGISMKMGVKKKDLDSTCAVHPTIAEEIVTLS